MDVCDRDPFLNIHRHDDPCDVQTLQYVAMSEFLFASRPHWMSPKIKVIPWLLMRFHCRCYKT